MSREASVALVHLANLLVARAELRLDLDAVAAVWTEIESLAEQKRASDPSLSKEAAVSKVMSEQPALYQRYVAAGGR